MMTERLSVLGVDPGNDGAAVLLDPAGKVLVAVGWHRLTWAVRILPWTDGAGVLRISEQKIPNLHAVGTLIAEQIRTLHGFPTSGRSQGPEAVGQQPLYRLAVEGLFGEGPTLAGLAWEAGLVAGPLLGAADGGVLRPKAVTWRPAVLGIRGNDKNAGALALKLAPIRFPGLGSLSTWEHACEAACIAEYARTGDRQATLALVSPPPKRRAAKRSK